MSMDPKNPNSFCIRKISLTSGRDYQFVDEVPDNYSDTTYTPTLLCIHGFPDLWQAALLSVSGGMAGATKFEDRVVSVIEYIPSWTLTSVIGHTATNKATRLSNGKIEKATPMSLNSNKCKEVLRGLLAVEADERYGFGEIENSWYMRNVVWGKLERMEYPAPMMLDLEETPFVPATEMPDRRNIGANLRLVPPPLRFV
ncbi:hypothetical protein BDZ89DRAFT_1129592 [Hymenopellis radicata]|nr:hypothetical protein BDZ89DRAFT_1129592 [Hymenopellis radicata]